MFTLESLQEYLRNIEEPVLLSSIRQKYPDVSESDTLGIINTLEIRGAIYKLSLCFPPKAQSRKVKVRYTVAPKPKLSQACVSSQPDFKKYSKIHELNELKDMRDALYGRLAELEGKMIQEIQKEFEGEKE